MKRQKMLVSKRKQAERGNAIVEMAFLAPWVFFIFVGVFDFGFYAYAAICTQNAARAGAMRTSVDPYSQAAGSALACSAAIPEMNMLPNLRGVASCGSGSSLVVTQSTRCGSSTDTTVVTTCPNSNPACADCTTTPQAASTFVAVTYTSIPLIPIPGMLPGKLTFTRTAEMRIVVP